MSEFASIWTEVIFRACWQGALLIVLVACICRFCQNLSAGTKCALWWLACGKLALGLFWISPPAIPLLPAEKRVVEVGAIALDQTSVGLVGVKSPGGVSIGPISPKSPISNAEPLVNYPMFIAVLWMFGAAIVLATRLAQSHKIRHVLGRATQLNDRRTLEISWRVASQMGMKEAPIMRASGEINMPMVAGLMRPALFLPEELRNDMPENELRMALAHEFAHIRRRDLWWSILPAIVQALFFFFPPAWWATREFALCREAACDAEAVAAIQAEPASYGRMLIRFVHTSGASWSVAALGSSLCYRSLERRLKMLHNQYSLGQMTRTVAFFFIGAVLIMVLPWRLTAQQATTSPDKPATPPAAAKPKAAPKAKQSGSRDSKPKVAEPAAPAAEPREETPPTSAATTPEIAATEPKSADNAPAQEAAPADAPRHSTSPASEPAGKTSPTPTAADNAPAALSPLPQELAKPLPVTAAPQALTTARPTRAGSRPLRPAQTSTPATVRAAITVPVQATPVAATATSIAPIAAQVSGTVTPSRQYTSVMAQNKPTPPMTGAANRMATAQKPLSVSVTGVRSKPGQPVNVTVELEKVINLDLEQTSCLAAIKRVFKHFGVDYRIDQDAASIAGSTNVTLHMNKAPMAKALQMILQSTRVKGEPLTYRVENGVYIIMPTSSSIKPAEAAKAYDGAVHSVLPRIHSGNRPISDQTVTLHAVDEDIRNVFRMLFNHVGVSYTMDPSVQGKVSVSMTDVPFRTVLESILRSTQSQTPLTYRVEDGVYIISPKNTTNR